MLPCRVWGKFQEQIQSAIAESGGVKKVLSKWATDVASQDMLNK